MNAIVDRLQILIFTCNEKAAGESQIKSEKRMFAKVQAVINKKYFIAIYIAWLFLVFIYASNNANHLTPDSLAYLNAATLFSLEGNYGNAYVYWPPFYPFVLSFYHYANLDINAFASYLNKLLLLATVISLWLIARRAIFSASMLCFMLAMATLSGPFEVVFRTTWSEALYIPLCVFTTYFWIAFLSEKYTKLNLLMSCLLLSLSMLTRHVGIALLVAMFGTLLLSQNFNIREKVKFFLCLTVSALPYVWWLFRTWSISGHLTGPRAVSLHSNFLFHLDKTGNIISHWMIHHFYFQSMGLLVAAIVGVFFAALFVIFTKRYTHPPCIPGKSVSYKLQLMIFLIAYTVLHSLLVIISASRFSIDPMNDRLLAPIYWSVIIIVFMSFQFVWEFFDRRKKYRSKRAVEYFGALYFLLWLSGPNTINDLIF